MLGSLLTASTDALRERSYERTGNGASLGFRNPFIETLMSRASLLGVVCQPLSPLELSRNLR